MPFVWGRRGVPTCKVIVLGGGVAGMSAAHELMERSGAGVDFEVHVYERRMQRTGGKARTIPVPDSARDGRAPLPGEHGFRFFPGFYKHLPDTMQRIPVGSGRTAFDNLVVANRVEIARMGKAPIILASRFPSSLGDLVVDFKAMFTEESGLRPGEVEFFAERIWQILTSCEARRLAEYEKITWWDYLKADKHSQAFRDLLVGGLSRSLLANDPHFASVRTVGDTNIQLMLGIADPGHPVDRLLNGPTSKVWIDPWRRYLEAKDVSFHLGTFVETIAVENGKVASVTVMTAAGESVVKGDVFIFALPVERMAELLKNSARQGTRDPVRADPALAKIVTLSSNVRWMNGIQFFLYKDVPLTHGHLLFADSPWALTAISEAQFWSQEHLPASGDGTVQGVISACISSWHTEGIGHSKPAIACTRDQIAEQVWAQIQAAVNVDGRNLLETSNRHSWFLDPDIAELPGDGVHLADAEPLFVNFIDSWKLRPDAQTSIANMFLASDYVRTFTDVACMEAANEAARRAVNGVLALAGSKAEPCELWQLHEPAWLGPFRSHDRRRFEKGLPWDGHIL